MLKLVAGVITGSIAIVTEAIHSSIDLVASVVAYFSVRKADEPADESHPYGHQKVENLAAGIEGMLILAGAARDRRSSRCGGCSTCPRWSRWASGIAVIGFSMVANVGVSTYLYRQAARTDSPALEGDAAHLRTDAMTSFGVLVGLLAGGGDRPRDLRPDHRAGGGGGDRGGRPAHHHPHLARAGGRGAAAPRSSRRCGARSRSTGREEVVGFHKLRARRAGSRRYVDLHVQFRDGTTLARAHEVSHEIDARRSPAACAAPTCWCTSSRSRR